MGHIRCESEEEVGSTFILQFPLHSRKEGERHAGLKRSDDENRILSGIERSVMMYNPDWECRFASSGPQALTMLEETPADVVVSDMRMPFMDGAGARPDSRSLARYGSDYPFLAIQNPHRPNACFRSRTGLSLNHVTVRH
jgi:CheY-like chemotaxis protein